MTTLSKTIAIILGMAISGGILAQDVTGQVPVVVQDPSQVQAQDPSAMPAQAPQGFEPVNPPVNANPNAYTPGMPQVQQGTAQTESAVQPQGSPPPGVYSTQAPPPGMVPNPDMHSVPPGPPPASVQMQQYEAQGVSAAPMTPPASLPPLPGPNTAEMAWATDNLMSVTPEQIRELRRLVDERQRATAEIPNPPRSVTGSISVSLSPGSTPPVIRPFIGSTSSFVVVDSTGAPWPVENFRIANPEVFPVNRLDGPHGSAFTVDTSLPYGQSNLILKLAGVSAPVVISLVAGQREHDARVEVRVQGRGPNSTVASGSLMAGTDARLLPVLDGMPPSGGKPLMVDGVENVRAWLLPSGRIMVRSPVKVISPASTEFVISADGTHVYEFARTTQLLGMVDGRYVPMNITGW